LSFPTAFFFSLKEKRKMSGEKEKRMADCLCAICLSQLQSNWLFLFFKPKGVSSLTKRRKGLGEKEKRMSKANEYTRNCR